MESLRQFFGTRTARWIAKHEFQPRRGGHDGRDGEDCDDEDRRDHR